MDILIRALHLEAGEVESGYYGSVFMGHVSPVDMLEFFNAVKAFV